VAGLRHRRPAHLTGGALSPALAGVAALPVATGPVIVDLADVLFDDGRRGPSSGVAARRAAP